MSLVLLGFVTVEAIDRSVHACGDCIDVEAKVIRAT